MRRSRADRPIAWHVGRRGEVAGGMTQVVNGYLDWSFEHFDTEVIVSRDGSAGVRAAGLAFGALARILTVVDPHRDIAVVHLSQGGSFVREGGLLRAARRRGIATVAHLHGSSFVEYAESNSAAVAAVLGSADRVIVLSEPTKDAVLQHLPAERVVLVPNAVPQGSPVDKEPRVVFGGAVSRRKGVDVLVDAWRRSGPFPGWTLELAGPLTDADLDLSGEGIVVHGSLPHGELMGILDAAAVAVLPSRDEAMPMFILEAMAREACVIATSVGGIPPVLAGVGVLVEPGDGTGLSVALRNLVDDPATRTALARAGRARFLEQYSAQAIYPRLEEVWASARNERRGRG